MNNFNWAADIVNPQQTPTTNNVTSVNKNNDEAMAAMVSSLLNNEESMSTTNQVPTTGSGKDIYKFIEQYLQSKENDCPPNGKDETGCKTTNPENNGKHVDQPNLSTDADESKPIKRAGGGSNDQPTKYQRLGEEGKIVSGYYTPIADEKLQGFQSTYINVGSPRCVKEVVGIRKNSQFVSTGKKKSVNDKPFPAYLVVSFENRKKSNSPFIEYPLTKLGVIIKALEELRERMIQQGYYSEPQIIKCHYPENTIITDKNCKDTILNTIE